MLWDQCGEIRRTPRYRLCGTSLFRRSEHARGIPKVKWKFTVSNEIFFASIRHRRRGLAGSCCRLSALKEVQPQNRSRGASQKLGCRNRKRVELEQWRVSAGGIER